MKITTVINQRGRVGKTASKWFKIYRALMMALFVYTFARRSGGR